MAERVLVFGDDAKAFLGVVRSLGRAGIEVHAAPSDFAAPALKSRYLAAAHWLPPYALGAGEWAQAVRALIDRERIGLVVPTGDSSLLMLLRHADALGRERLAVPNPEAAAAFTDKANTRRLAFECGVPVCAGRAVAADDGAEALAESFGLPLVLKPRRSWSPDELRFKRPARIVRSIAALRTALAPGLAGQWVVESFFAGRGVGLSVLAREGEILAAIQHRRLHEENETGPSTRRTSEPASSRLLAWVRDLAAAVRLTGVAMFEFRWDPRQDEYVLLEVNPRFWGSLPLALAAGADFPAMLHALHAGAAPDALAGAGLGYRAGCVKADLEGEFNRLSGNIDAAAGRRGRIKATAAALAQLPPLWRPSAFDSWAADDPDPFLEERRMLLARLGAAVSRRVPPPELVRAMAARRRLRRLAGRAPAGPMRLLVVGSGNVCRSPFAERLLRERVRRSGAAIEIASAGTLPIEDRPPSAATLTAAARYGVDLGGHRSRSLTPAALLSASAILVFDAATAERLRGFAPGVEAPVLRLPDLTDARDIAEPSGDGLGLFLGEFRRISESVSVFASEIGQYLLLP